MLHEQPARSREREGDQAQQNECEDPREPLATHGDLQAAVGEPLGRDPVPEVDAVGDDAERCEVAADRPDVRAAAKEQQEQQATGQRKEQALPHGLARAAAPAHADADDRQAEGQQEDEARPGAQQPVEAGRLGRGPQVYPAFLREHDREDHARAEQAELGGKVVGDDGPPRVLVVGQHRDVVERDPPQEAPEEAERPHAEKDADQPVGPDRAREPGAQQGRTDRDDDVEERLDAQRPGHHVDVASGLPRHPVLQEQVMGDDGAPADRTRGHEQHGRGQGHPVRGHDAGDAADGVPGGVRQGRAAQERAKKRPGDQEPGQREEDVDPDPQVGPHEVQCRVVGHRLGRDEHRVHDHDQQGGDGPQGVEGRRAALVGAAEPRCQADRPGPNGINAPPLVRVGAAPG